MTQRLLLRELVEADWGAVHQYASDPEVVRYLPWGPNTEAETRAFVRRRIASQQEDPRRQYEFAVVLKAEGLFIGTCGLHLSGPEDPEAWVGYALSRRFWGQGYATEAARALLAFGFDELGLHRIFATRDPANVASARVLEKIGMRREGLLQQHLWGKGRWHDRLLYAILDCEWEPARPE